MKKLIFVIGASGVGKTTTVKALEKAPLPNYQICYFDSIGVPSFTQMNEKYKSPEEWQRVKTIEWVKTIKETLLSHTHVILDGQTRPTFIEDACLENEITDYEVILFDCSDAARTKRLVERGHPELADQQMMNWAKYLRQESQKRNYKTINNTHLNSEDTFHLLIDWLKGQTFDNPEITLSLAVALIAEQFPQWAHLPIRSVELSGNDNRTFRLGEEMSIRLPSAEGYEAQVQR